MQTVRQIGRYELLEQLALGGAAELYRAVLRGPSGFNKPVVLKRLLSQYSDDEEFRELFLHEGRIMAALHHRNLLQVLDIGEADGELYLCLELVSGGDLAALLNRSRSGGVFIAPALAAWLAREVCEGLHYVHTLCDEAGQPLQVVHRDVTPHNILLSRHGDVKLGDFGIAKSHARTRPTQAGCVRGKVAYLSPEQARGGPTVPATDIYAVGLVLFEMLTLERYLGASSADFVATIDAAVSPRWRSPSDLNPAVSPELESIVERALRVSPEERFDSARAMAEALTDLLEACDESPDAAGVADLVDEAFGPERGGPRLTVADEGDIAAHFETRLHPNLDHEDGDDEGTFVSPAASSPTALGRAETTRWISRGGLADPTLSSREELDPGGALPAWTETSPSTLGLHPAQLRPYGGIRSRRRSIRVPLAVAALATVPVMLLLALDAGSGVDDTTDRGRGQAIPASHPPKLVTVTGSAGPVSAAEQPAAAAAPLTADHGRQREPTPRTDSSVRPDPVRQAPRTAARAVSRGGSAGVQGSAAAGKPRRKKAQPEVSAREVAKPAGDALDEGRVRLQSVSAKLAALGARAGDWPAGEVLLARAKRDMAQGNARAAQTALKRAEAALAKLSINKAFVERKIRRLEEALGAERMRKTFPKEVRSVLRSLLANRFDDANAALNQIIDNARGLSRVEGEHRRP